MAAVAIVVINAAPGDLPRIESEFGVTFAALDVTAGQRPQHHYRATETQSKQFRIFNSAPPLAGDKNARLLHLSFKRENKPLQ